MRSICTHKILLNLVIGFSSFHHTIRLASAKDQAENQFSGKATFAELYLLSFTFSEIPITTDAKSPQPSEYIRWTDYPQARSLTRYHLFVAVNTS